MASGVILRPRLAAVIDAGPGDFLRGVDVRPAFADNQFTGWEIVSFWPGDPRYGDLDLAPGDVVRRVNGRVIQRPEELQQVWESLRFAPELLVEVDRQGEARQLRFTITP